MTTGSETEAQSSFGIRKIVDCKLDKNGKELYKVKWEPTWEPAENLASCQHLIDKFWKFVNTAKSYESFVSQKRKRLFSDSSSNSTNSTNNLMQHILTEDNKTEVQQLIIRTNATSAGNVSLQNIPTKNKQKDIHQNNLMGQLTMQNKLSSSYNSIAQNHGTMPLMNSPTQKVNSLGPTNTVTPPKVMKTEIDDSNAMNLNKSSNNDLDNFDNPYVRIAYLCKICSKEQSKKFKFDWKRHYLTHDAGRPKPFLCKICNKDFAQQGLLNKHMKSHENNSRNNNKSDFEQMLMFQMEPKSEVLPVKTETFYLE